MLHASHALVPVMVDGELRWAIVESEQLEIIDDWDVAAMAATGSVTIVATDAIIPEKRTLSFQKMMSATDHDGVFHEEEEGGAGVTVRCPCATSAMCDCLAPIRRRRGTRWKGRLRQPAPMETVLGRHLPRGLFADGNDAYLVAM